MRSHVCVYICVYVCVSGATCYLNSLIQGLYMTPEFRAALFQWKPAFADELAAAATARATSPPPAPSATTSAAASTSASSVLSAGAPGEFNIPYQLQLLFARLALSVRGAVDTKGMPCLLRSL
jgi:hypothetical protein